MDNNLKIEEFIDGNLTEKELQELMILTESNPNFKKDVVFRAEVNDALRDKRYAELRKLLNERSNNMASSSNKFWFQNELLKTWHLAAASFSLLLVVGGLWYILSNKPFSTERLVTKYYKPAHPILQIRSAEMNTDDALKEAFSFYKQNDYTNALKYFNSLDNQITAKFYSGVCYIELEQYNKAIDSFEYVISDRDNLFVEQAEWYLGLIYLMNNQKNQAIDQFEKISDSDSYYSNQAEEILKYLN